MLTTAPTHLTCAVVAIAALVSGKSVPGRPPTLFTARVARWLVHETNWGTIATVSNGHDSGTVGNAFANPMSHSDGIYNSTDPKQQTTGIPYFLMTALDETPQDIKLNPMGSFAISEEQIVGDSICIKTDDEDPTCSRISMTGQFVDVSANGTAEEQSFALQALYSRHPEMPEFGKPGTGDHDFHIYKLVIKSIFFLDFYGGSAPLSLEKYYGATPLSAEEAKATVYTKRHSPATRVARPPASNAAALARWLVQVTNWGTIATMSNGHDSGTVGNAWANPESFSDGIANSTDPKQQSTGTPYFLMTPLDETPQDIKLNPMGSFAISEEQIVDDPICSKTDDEDPTCARISFTGKFVDVSATGTAAEQSFALQALYSRHPEMPEFGKPGVGEHDFHIYKLVIETVFFLDDYGGGCNLTAAEYYAA